jgi:hypothetical protein
LCFRRTTLTALGNLDWKDREAAVRRFPTSSWEGRRFSASDSGERTDNDELVWIGMGRVKDAARILCVSSCWVGLDWDSEKPVDV